MSRKKELDFELNIIPMIDILSVCICFLLMTIVWIQVGAIKSAQSLGGQAKTAKTNPPAIWATLTPSGMIQLDLKDVPKNERFSKQVPLSAVPQVMAFVKSHVPTINTGLVMPSKLTAYSDIISVMDQMKKVGIKDVGISPL